MPAHRALRGRGKAEKFAEICAAVALAGEISIAGAMCAGHFARAHQELGRVMIPSVATPAVSRSGPATPSTDPSPGARPPGGPDASIHERAAFDFIRYGSVWEDADVLCEALAPVARGGRILSIASAGDNALALLTLDPAEVVAADVSAAQIACLELRIAAFRRLDDAALLAFLGATRSDDRLSTYRALRPLLPTHAAAFWDARPAVVAEGVIHAGKFERYLRVFRRFVLPLVHSRPTLDALCEPRTIEEQRRFDEDRWDTWRWRGLFRLFFSRWAMGRLGRDPAFFDQVDGPVGERILARSRHALTEISASDNPFLVTIMTGNYRPGALPRYLRPEHIATIRDRLDRVRPIEAAVERAGDGCFDAFNLSDIFEYMSSAEHQRCYTALLDRAAPGARLAYWNLLAPRSCPVAASARVRPLANLAASLHARDRAWFYERFHLDEVARGSL
jgi:S-adenosylmethionine-diacylglycerol 3-amino-3-carboxypropyl transferase